MRSGVIPFIFFANYFVGLLAVALSVETAFQLEIPLADGAYYILLFSGTAFYYTYAYIGATLHVGVHANPRVKWYVDHRQFILLSQKIWLSICIITGTYLLYKYHEGIFDLPISYWLGLATIPLAALLYYGLGPAAINLRFTGWLKALVIGFVWAGTVSVLPVVIAKIEYRSSVAQPDFMFWLFIKNLIFCTVNAIMFDIKDYEDDSNIQLKTFVVKFGLKKTIFFILIPLLVIGVIALLCFTYYKGFSPIIIGFNLIPFVILLFVAYSLRQPKSILYYLIVIDGLLLLKAICGISGIVLLRLFS